MEPIEVNTHFENPEYPTRVTIIDLDGHFEHAGDYTHPKYIFSVKVEVKYNKVVEGKEDTLITCSLWTNKDSAQFPFEDDDLDEASVEDWFLEGLSDDLSFHGLDCLEHLDFYSQGVPTNDEGCNKLVKCYIAETLNKIIPTVWHVFECFCSELYYKKEKNKCQTVWNIKSLAPILGDSEEWVKKCQEDAKNAYDGFLWRTYSYMTDTVRSYKQASFEGMKKDLAEMNRIGQELAFRAELKAEEEYWLLKRGSTLREQLKNCDEWLEKLGVEHWTWEEYVKRPWG